MQQAQRPQLRSFFVILKPFKERQKPHLGADAIMAGLRKRWAKEITEAKVIVFGSSPIPGLSSTGGFKVIVEDRGGLGLPTLQDRTDKLIRKMTGDSYQISPAVAGMRKAGLPDTLIDKLTALGDETFNGVQFGDKLAETLRPWNCSITGRRS